MPHAGREGVFSRVKQSDMCLVCIAFASWVLRSADPESADTWKAGMKICIDIPLTFFSSNDLSQTVKKIFLFFLESKVIMNKY